MKVQVQTPQGDVTYLPSIKPKGGGMVQGLSMPSPLYTLLPCKLQERMASLLPDVAVKVHPQLLQINRSTKSVPEQDLRPITVQDIRNRAWTLERVVPHDQSQEWTEEQEKQIKTTMQECRTDAERLLLIDWMATANWGRQECSSLTTHDRPPHHRKPRSRQQGWQVAMPKPRE